jgi:hypothetical protein
LPVVRRGPLRSLLPADGEKGPERSQEAPADGKEARPLPWLALLKAFSERERDFDDLTALLEVLGRKLDLAYIRSWTKRIDESIGSHDVSQRLDRALAVKARPRRL